MSRYRKLAQLGRGGMARVWLAVSRGPAGFRKLVVVKELRPELARDEESRRMFLDEARLAARLGHPNVVQTLEVGEDEGGDLFLVMEYLDGQSLRAVHKRRRPPLALEVRILADVLAGLHHAHELRDFDGTLLSVVHRDVSPHNVFITYDGHTKVVDFGIAQALTSTSETAGALLKGKLAYMPPEQARGLGVDRRADVFAAGVMLWECLAGRRIWAGLSDATLLYRLGAGDLPELSEHAPDAPPALVEACRAALAPDPLDRTPSAAALRDQLEDWLRGQPSTTDAAEVAAFMGHVFAEDRAQMRRIIDEHLNPARESATTPPLGADLDLDEDLLIETGDEEEETIGTGRSWRLDGPYSVGRLLGETSRAEVHEGEQVRVGVPVVLKFRLPRAEGDDAESRRSRLLRAAALTHPATCRVLDVVDASSPVAAQVVVREHVPGSDLGVLLRSGTPVDARRGIRAAIAVLRSLGEAHERGLVHGRLDPSHVLLTPDTRGDETAKVIGYEELPWTAADEADARGWIAPEVAAGAEPDPRADLYAVGALLRASLLGGLDAPEPRGGGPSPRRVASLASLQELLTRALTPRPGDRYASVTELLGDLARVEAEVHGLDGGVEALDGSPELAVERGTATLRARHHRMLSLARPTVWVLDDDPGTRDPTVRAALERVGTRHPVRWLDEGARNDAADALVHGDLDPPWVVVFGDLHVLLGERLLMELGVSAEVSRFLVSTHANLELLDSTINRAGLEHQVVLPATAEAIVDGVAAMIDRTRRLRHRYDSVRFSLREARDRIQAFAQGGPTATEGG